MPFAGSWYFQQAEIISVNRLFIQHVYLKKISEELVLSNPKVGSDKMQGIFNGFFFIEIPGQYVNLQNYLCSHTTVISV